MRIYDAKVEWSSIVGANRQFVEETIPPIGRLLQSSLAAVVRDSEVIVAGRDAREFRDLRNLLKPEHIVIQLARSRSLEDAPGRQTGICW